MNLSDRHDDAAFTIGQEYRGHEIIAVLLVSRRT